MSFSLRRSPFLSFAVLAVLVSACASPIRPRGIDSEGLVVGRLKSVNPLEVVVPRIENKTGKTNLPLDVMRDDFQKGLVALRYSPLSLDFVDRNVKATEASYSPGTLGEQATLKVVLTNWDSSRWSSHATLVVDADVYLLDANDPDPSHALWGGHTTRSVDLSRQRQQFISDEAMLRRAVELTVDGILVALPSRDPEKAPTTR
ncbi:MAG: hypothetical protein NTV21_17745 [Planctomycetota bacterium]|nr:hypothetical protein [Planctomycetota bacterium]